MQRISICVLVLMAGCGGGGGDDDDDVDAGAGVPGNARLYNGPTPAGTSFAVRGPQKAAENGRWLISPDTLTLTLTGVNLAGPGGEAGLATVNCAVTFDQAQAGLAELGACPFAIAPGTYDSLTLVFSTAIEILIDDPINELYSTASGVQVTAPGGGAAPYAYEVSGFGGGQFNLGLPLAAPVTVADGDTLELSIVINAMQSLHFTVGAGGVTPGWDGTSYVDPGRPDIVATVGSLAKIKLYASPTLASAGSYCAGQCVNPPMGITSVSIYYTSETSVLMAGLQLNGQPASCTTPGSGSFINDPRSYTGIDGAGVVGWAGGTDDSWSTYSVLYAMPQVADIGGSTPLYCATTSTDPMPPGGSFASGAPDIQTAGNSLGDYVLVAQ